MIGGLRSPLTWGLTVLVLIAGAVLVIVATVGTGRENPVAQTTCPSAGSCSSPTASANGSTAGPSSAGVHSPTPTSKRTSPSPTPTTPKPTAGPTSAPPPPPAPPPPATSSSAPAASGYFGLRAAGTWTSLPTDAQCAAAIHKSTWEPRPQNYQQNHTEPASGAMAASFSTRPRNQGGTYNSLWDTWLLRRVDGRFTGTTDEILQWAACKWGLPDNVFRADAVEESTWFQYLHYPNDASSGGGGGSCYWNRGCGDAFSSPTTASITYCNGLAIQGLLSSEVHNYQKDPVTSVGGYPYAPTSGMCPKTFSILGVMSWDNPAWEAPYPAYPGNQNGTFPFTRDSTAAAADYWGAYIRGCYEGWAYWLKSSGPYAAGDLWGCVGSWYSGDWHSSAANGYISRVQGQDNSHTWLTASFDNASGQYGCDPKYGCAT